MQPLNIRIRIKALEQVGQHSGIAGIVVEMHAHPPTRPSLHIGVEVFILFAKLGCHLLGVLLRPPAGGGNIRMIARVEHKPRAGKKAVEEIQPLREAQEQIADLDLKLAASTAVGTQTTEAQIAVGAASESRALLTRLVAERDRLVAQ